MMMFVLVFGMVFTFSSCSSDDDNATTTEGINSSLIPGQYVFNGNIAPDFTLYKDGTCYISTSNTSNDKWSYNKSTQTLLVGTHVYKILMLTEENLVAEWTSVKYGTSTSSWKRSQLTK